jgi:hypothetical protein
MQSFKLLKKNAKPRPQPVKQEYHQKTPVKIKEEEGLISHWF